MSNRSSMANHVHYDDQIICDIVTQTPDVVSVRKKSSFDRYRLSIYKYIAKNKLKEPTTRNSEAMLRQVSLSHPAIKWYHKRKAAYIFLQKPDGPFGRAYHMIVSFLILICLVLTILCTFEEITITLNEALYGFDLLIMVILIIEFSVRLWASECISYYRGFKGKVRFLLRPFRIIDMIVISTSLMITTLSVANHYLVPSLQWIRFFQTFKMLRLEHRFRPWKVMASVIWSQREHLYITIFTSILALFLTAFLVYFVERDVNPSFSNLGQALWWAAVTLCTIGYGDIAPITALGKVLASICSVIGVSLFALPAGILGTGLALKVEEKQRLRQIGKRKIPAVLFIQSVWRFHYFNRNPTKACAMFERRLTKTAPKRMSRKTLNNKEFNSFYFVLKTKCFVCRQHFAQTLKPYDVKDVLDQYSTGQLEMLSRLKHIHHKIASVEIASHSNLKAQVEAKNLFNYRLVNVEKAIEVTDNKLDQLIQLQLDNKELYENILTILDTSNQNTRSDDSGQENSVI